MPGATSTASCTERRRLVVEFWLALVLAVITLGRLLRRLDTLSLGTPPATPPMTAYWRRL
jgi:hypothetical protein